MYSRSEDVTLFQTGVYEPFNYGLDEFLQLCELFGYSPILQINIRKPVQDTIDLIEYIFGATSTTYGALRATNGHNAPYSFSSVFIELGNEPAPYYSTNNNSDVAGSAYATQTIPHAIAFWQKIKSLSLPSSLIDNIELCGVGQAQWIYFIYRTLIPWANNWNTLAAPLFANAAANVTSVDIHYYANVKGNTDEEFSRFYKDFIGGASMISPSLNSPLSLFNRTSVWLTEFGLVAGDNSDEVTYANFTADYRAALTLAEVEFQVLKSNNIRLATVWNLAQPIFGMIALNRSMTSTGIASQPQLRPAGQMMSFLSDISSRNRLDVISVGDAVPVADANTPLWISNTTYDQIEVIAGQFAGGLPKVYIFNKNETTNMSVTLNLNWDYNVTAWSVCLFYSDNLNSVVTLDSVNTYVAGPNNVVQDNYVNCVVNGTDYNFSVQQGGNGYRNRLTVTVPRHSILSVDVLGAQSTNPSGGNSTTAGSGSSLFSSFVVSVVRTLVSILA
eukprot:TRINITY_DN7325_c0_g1_i1.p1 TRINITY_DN7325_c0_g1~~TRINITY_DN7325_c0_g1_i1.p1  ORF type:complete len:502 (-),score=84.73 TRINITY_DN7325_c0_g1_i1:65-1570(-)